MRRREERAVSEKGTRDNEKAEWSIGVLL